MQMLYMDIPYQTDSNFGYFMESILFEDDTQLMIGSEFPNISYDNQPDGLRPENCTPLLGENHFTAGRKDVAASSEWKKTSNKRIKLGATASYHVEQHDDRLHHDIPVQEEVSNHTTLQHHHKLNATDGRRRSQKLSDKITALQKLVSPYGKTDTATVLQEACLCIKLLQEQIQVLGSSYKQVTALHTQGIGGKHVELRSTGLCLVPVSFAQKLAMGEDGADYQTTY